MQWNLILNIIDAKDRDNIDLSQFSNPDFIPAGEYLTDITLNGRKLSGQYLIKFIEESKDTFLHSVLHQRW
ncbi:FimD/PapC N-terminal domain-containing protein [Providencia hangzhouensis]|uniref:FimD/PapC N-terminal domain-containing protein n=1 Tax=Providencia hangzhouensis TaxID=3031799 RepID=UPI0034DD1BB5